MIRALVVFGEGSRHPLCDRYVIYTVINSYKYKIQFSLNSTNLGTTSTTAGYSRRGLVRLMVYSVAWYTGYSKNHSDYRFQTIYFVSISFDEIPQNTTDDII